MLSLGLVGKKVVVGKNNDNTSSSWVIILLGYGQRSRPSKAAKKKDILTVLILQGKGRLITAIQRRKQYKEKTQAITGKKFIMLANFIVFADHTQLFLV